MYARNILNSLVSIHHRSFYLSENESYMKVLIVSFTLKSVYYIFMYETNVYLVDGTERESLMCHFNLQRLQLLKTGKSFDSCSYWG